MAAAYVNYSWRCPLEIAEQFEEIIQRQGLRKTDAILEALKDWMVKQKTAKK